MQFLRLILLAGLLARIAAPQSVYTLEAIAADQFQPSIGFDEIGGLHIDAHGNVAGVARKGVGREQGGRSVGFYWPTADSVKPLMLENAEGRFDCEPVAMDRGGSVHLLCQGGRGAIFPVPFAARGSTDGTGVSRSPVIPSRRRSSIRMARYLEGFRQPLLPPIARPQCRQLVQRQMEN